MRNILLIIKNNLYRLTKMKIMLVMIIVVLPIIIYGGIYFSKADNIKGKIAIVNATSTQEEAMKKSTEGNDNITFEFLSKEPAKTDLIKGIYIAEINFEGTEPKVISYGNKEIKKQLEASLRGEVYESDVEITTIEGRIIGFLIMFLFMGSIMAMEFFLTDRENGTYVRVLSSNVSYYEYIIGQIAYLVCTLTVPTLIISLIMLKVLSIQLNMTIGLFSLLILIIGLLSSSFSALVCTLCKDKVSATMSGSAITMITCLLGGCIINIVDNNKIVEALRNLIPQKRLIDLANSYNNEDLIFIIVVIIVFTSISIVLGKRQYENGDFV
ncbi:MAG: ABC transporter permease [Clostridium sp.]|uniref:ABC transporter permease n=1 Tax=Clostridium sp. TaxID=1506 RepID=UPI002FCA91F2